MKLNRWNGTALAVAVTLVFVWFSYAVVIWDLPPPLSDWDPFWRGALLYVVFVVAGGMQICPDWDKT